MRLSKMTDRMLTNKYKGSFEPVELDILRRELWHRGFSFNEDGNIIYTGCIKTLKYVTCAFCTKSLWCVDYVAGGLRKDE